MNETENVRLLRGAYDHWGKNKEGAFENWMGLMADQVRFASIGGVELGGAFSKTKNSKEEVRGYFMDLAREWEMLSYEIHEFIAQGDRVVGLGRCRWRHRTTLKVVDTAKADVLTVKDGKIVDFYEFFDTAQTLVCSQT